MDAEIHARESYEEHEDQRDCQQVELHASPLLHSRQEDAKRKIRNCGHCCVAAGETERVSGHPDMPIFVFSPHDVEAIIQYLQSIQIKKP